MYIINNKLIISIVIFVLIIVFSVGYIIHNRSTYNLKNYKHYTDSQRVFDDNNKNDVQNQDLENQEDTYKKLMYKSCEN
jgi:uncharacterized protein YxeA